MSRAVTLGIALLSILALGQSWAKLEVGIDPPNGQIALTGYSEEGESAVLERSEDLEDWEPVFGSFESDWEFRDAVPTEPGETVFYRLRGESSLAIEPDEAWALELDLDGDALFSEPKSNGISFVRFAKFTILTADLSKVYFQDSKEYPFHYDFAVDKLAPFAGWDRDEFNRATLWRSGQVAILGEVVINEEEGEFGIRFVGEDEIPVEWIAYLYQLVLNALDLEYFVGDVSKTFQGYYMPVFQQTSVAARNRDYLEQRGIPVSSPAVWAPTFQCYSQGWAMGTLRFVEADRIEEAYLSGELKHTDILMTDGIPAELPYVAGIVSLSPASPGSHATLLAESYGIPFTYLSSVERVANAVELIGQEVIFDLDQNCRMHLLGTEGRIDDSIRDYLQGIVQTPVVDIPEKAAWGGYSADAVTLEPHDIVSFGGKAANFGFLLREIPENTRPLARAFSMDLWDDFMDQELEGGGRLKERIAELLSGYSWPVSDMGALDSDLRRVRDLIEDVAVFDSVQRSEILEAFQDFDTSRRIRIRSSTNVEDGEWFTGAGLYESKSGCLADDLDADDEGPSVCDPSNSKERGVFRAMRKVYGSFYNLNAFLERLRFGIDESKVGMALLAHYSYPDEIEMANGIVRYEFGDTRESIRTITQKGAVSVTNPEGEAIPEVANVLTGLEMVLVEQRSSLLAVEEELVMGEDDYVLLGRLVKKVGQAYRVYHDTPEDDWLVLEFEFKRVEPGVIEIKQVRLIPDLAPSVRKRVFIGGETHYSKHPSGERSSLWSSAPDFVPEVVNSEFEAHYMNIEMDLVIESWILDEESGDQSPSISSWAWTYQDSGKMERWSGHPTELEDFRFEENASEFVYEWSVNDSDFSARIGMSGGPGSIFVFADSRGIQLKRTYEEPKRAGDYFWWNSGSDSIYEDTAKREFNARFGAGSSLEDRIGHGQLQRRVISGPNGVLVEAEFYFPEPPEFSAGYTAPLIAWRMTKISGLTREPLVLDDQTSQSYAPEHHNFGEFFLFEPPLEEGLSSEQLAELKALDVMQIYVGVGGVKFIGFDGLMRSEL